MHNRLLWLLSLLLAGPLLAHAQEVPSTYQVEYDSLWQRAARVRAFVGASIAQSRTSFVALGGTSRRTISLARSRSLADGLEANAFRLVKEEITKHKTHGADVTKINYYATSGQLLLAELYQQHQLVRLQLTQYAQQNGRVRHKPYRMAEWVRGDYLRLTLYSVGITNPPRNYYFNFLRLPE
ncbi:hypothetical protein [Hymenobacter psoromatis]|uniref:hypothetical protein n=1 Tax=Hymenobacter psoromatis TaxID=1484116 RepID=UPI001CC13874|nr:hypothetical protein [Hymenobacter psoromatis]